MIKFNSDVTQFNNFVKAQLDALQARGETLNDIMVNLFKGYTAITDSQFKQYISQKINEYVKGSNITKELLMNLAENKYRTLLRAGEWRTPDEDQKEVLALRAQIEDLMKKKGNHWSAKMDWKKKALSNLQATKTYKNQEYNWCPKHIYGWYSRLKIASCQTTRMKKAKAMRTTPRTSGNWQMHWWQCRMKMTVPLNDCFTNG